MPRSVVFCITELDPGGAERALYETVRRFDRAKWTALVYCLGPETELAAKLRQEGISVVCLNAKRRHAFSAIRRLRAAWGEQRPAVVVTFLFHANLIGRLAARTLDVPVVACHRVAEHGVGWHLRLERFTRTLVTHHVMVSEAVRTHLIQHRIATPDNSSVIYNGVDVEHFRTGSSAEFDGDGPVVLFAGRLSKQKGVEDLLVAWPAVRAALPDAVLLIAGIGPLKGEVDFAASRDESIVLLGYVPDLAPWYRRVDAVVLPSLWEGLPNVLLESLAAGTPCVVSDVEGVQEVVGDSVEYLIRPGQPGELSAAVIQVLRGQTAGRTVEESLQAIVSTRFTWDSCSRKWQELLANLVRDE